MVEDRISVINVKHQNRQVVFDRMAACGQFTRFDIARETELSLGTVASRIEEFREQGVLVKQINNRIAVGRKTSIYQFVPEGKNILTFDLSTKKFTFSLLDLAFQSHLDMVHDFADEADFQTNLERFLSDIKKRTGSDSAHPGRPIGLGISVPGPYNIQTDRIENAPYQEIQQIPIHKTFRKYFNLPAAIDHDVFLALQSEVKEIDNFHEKSIFYLHLGEGIGGALWTSNAVHRGAHEDAGDIGQLMVEQGVTLEQQTSWNTVRDAVRDIAATDKDIFDLFRSGDARLLAVIREKIEILARVISYIFWITDPHVLILSGHYAQLGDPFAVMLNETLRAQGPSHRHSLKLAKNPYGSALHGAAEQVIQKWFKTF